MPTLLRIYLVRGIVAIAWAAGFAAVSDSLTAVTVVLLISYPLIDVVASLLDAREDPGTPARTLQIFNTTLSALAAIALGVAALRGVGAVLFAFGVWAIVSGIAQFTVAIRRRTALGRQWPMLIAGALSVIAGATYLPRHWRGPRPQHADPLHGGRRCLLRPACPDAGVAAAPADRQRLIGAAPVPTEKETTMKNLIFSVAAAAAMGVAALTACGAPATRAPPRPDDRRGDGGMGDREGHRQVGHRQAHLLRERNELLDSVELALVGHVPGNPPHARLRPFPATLCGSAR
jgi:uncharacterized membrane protein HdeD (DUF308 family)